MKRLLFALAAWLSLAGAAFAQSSPNLRQGFVPSAAQWNSYFQNKQDVLNYVPVNKAGDTMLGRLTAAAPSTTRSGFNILPGTAPSSPLDGDMWTTTGGLFIRIAGSTFQVSTGGATVNSSVAGNLAFYSGVAAISGNPNFTISASNLQAGIAGTAVGNYCMFNATSGILCLGPPTGAMGTLNVVFPLNSGTVAELNFAQSWTAAQTINATFTMGQQMVASGRVDATISADQNDWTPSGTGTYSQSSTVYVDGGAANRNITGITGGAAGRLLNIFNKGTTNNIVLKNGSVSSSAANRFSFAADVTLGPGTGMLVYYDGTASLWKAFGQVATSTITAITVSGAAQGGGSAGSVNINVAVASKSDQQTGTSTLNVVTPSQAQSHDSAAKAWFKVTNNGTATLTKSYNVTSINRTGVGAITITFTTAFDSSNYVPACAANAVGGSSQPESVTGVPTNATTLSIDTRTPVSPFGGVDVDFSCVVFGRQ